MNSHTSVANHYNNGSTAATTMINEPNTSALVTDASTINMNTTNTENDDNAAKTGFRKLKRVSTSSLSSYYTTVGDNGDDGTPTLTKGTLANNINSIPEANFYDEYVGTPLYLKKSRSRSNQLYKTTSSNLTRKNSYITLGSHSSLIIDNTKESDNADDSRVYDETAKHNETANLSNHHHYDTQTNEVIDDEDEDDEYRYDTTMSVPESAIEDNSDDASTSTNYNHIKDMNDNDDKEDMCYSPTEHTPNYFRYAHGDILLENDIDPKNRNDRKASISAALENTNENVNKKKNEKSANIVNKDNTPKCNKSNGVSSNILNSIHIPQLNNNNGVEIVQYSPSSSTSSQYNTQNSINNNNNNNNNNISRISTNDSTTTTLTSKRYNNNSNIISRISTNDSTTSKRYNNNANNNVKFERDTNNNHALYNSAAMLQTPPIDILYSNCSEADKCSTNEALDRYIKQLMKENPIHIAQPIKRPIITNPLIDIATFPTDKLLDMLSCLLTKIVRSNDRLHQGDVEGNVTDNTNTKVSGKYNKSLISFKGKTIPGISLENYLKRIFKFCPTTNDVFLSLLVYFDRIAKRYNNNNNGGTTNDTGDTDSSNGTITNKQKFVMDSYNIHRLIIAGVTVSTKFFSDFYYANSRYARVGGLSCQELNNLELQFLILCNFELIITVEDLQKYADLLFKFWTKENALEEGQEGQQSNKGGANGNNSNNNNNNNNNSASINGVNNTSKSTDPGLITKNVVGL